ncbi:parallel beta-helix repeat-containing protein [Caballeronia udeis]|uniref:Parallel beta-helix repeat-containing protein n=1 Tax=Caballeronia udeis TaxID=1232866 RepID=A0A158EPD9_9BURK|nr:hypothetical protein [Caballeronia udeis]SAL09343.1 parallel beta-helix repeat-containing protein [Caballeronia udeis]
MTTMVNISPTPMQRFVDSNGNALVGGLLFTYQAGTTTKFATYTDSTGDTQNTNPIVLNQRGEASIWLIPTQSYKFVLAPSTDTDPPSAAIWTQDNIQAASSVTVGNMSNQTFSAGVDFTPGTTTSLTLTNPYGTAANLWVDFDGIEQHDFTLSGFTLTFISPIPVGIGKVYVKGGTSLTLGTPANDSVGDAQLSWGNALVRCVDSVSALAALDPSIYTRAFSTGDTTVNDGFGGFYYYSASTPQSQANGASIIAAAGGVGCWINLTISLPQTVTRVALTGQTAQIPATTPLIAPLIAGMFRINFYLTITTAGTGGTFTPNFSFNDGSGPKTVSGGAANATAGGYSEGSIVFYTGNVTFDFGVAASGITGSPVFSLYMTVERIS